MSEEPLLQCYNKGCGQKFKASENTETSCRFHPGDNFFHDAYKGWTCCNRKTVDFTEFLNMKGCAYSFHSNEKPPEVEKKREVVEDVYDAPAQPVYKPMERPSPDLPIKTIKKELSDSLKKQTYNTEQVQNKDDQGIAEIVPGETKCVNNGCKVIYQGPETDQEVCNHHPGVPIFHEGLKYWSCCQKRTTEFEVFMNQKGCTPSTHVWIKPKDDSQVGIKCRQDWHQTGSHVILVIYAKKFDPSRSEVKANGVKLNVKLYFPEEKGFYREEWILAGIIEPDECSVFMTPMKLEIKLKKAEPISWKNFSLRKEDENKVTQPKNEYNTGVDALDLSDL